MPAQSRRNRAHGSRTRPVLLTGASGALGRVLAHGLAAQGFTLRLTDIAPFPGDLPAGRASPPWT